MFNCLLWDGMGLPRDSVLAAHIGSNQYPECIRGCDSHSCFSHRIHTLSTSGLTGLLSTEQTDPSFLSSSTWFTLMPQDLKRQHHSPWQPLLCPSHSQQSGGKLPLIDRTDSSLQKKENRVHSLGRWGNTILPSSLKPNTHLWSVKHPWELHTQL